MKQRILTTIIALLSLAMGAKAATTTIELYDSQAWTDNIESVLQVLVTNKILEIEKDGKNIIFLKNGERLFGVEVDKLGNQTIRVPRTVIPSIDSFGAVISGDRYRVNFSVVINSTTFPNTKFRTYVKSFDTETRLSPGRLTSSECNAVTEIDVSSQEIDDLKGVEYFTKLTYLDCAGNKLKELDVSKNTELTYLKFGGSELFTSLDLSNNTKLSELCIYYTKLTTIDLSKNTALEQLYCYYNQLTELDVSKNNALKILSCYNNQLTELDVSGLTKLENLTFGDETLTTVDMSGCTALTYFYYWKVGTTPLTTIKASGCTALDFFSCCETQLKELDVSGCTALENLYCYNNQLSKLNVSGCTALTYLNCNDNKLTSLDVSECTALDYLGARNNKLTTLDVSNNKVLRGLDFAQNQIRGAGMATLVDKLPQTTEGWMDVYYDEAPDGNLMTRIQALAAKEKGWEVLKWDESAHDWVDYTGEVVAGDANGDGEVTADDVNAVCAYILGLLPDDQPFDEESADVSNDGTVDIVDVTRLIELLKVE